MSELLLPQYIDVYGLQLVKEAKKYIQRSDGDIVIVTSMLIDKDKNA